ncbi:hypothetical protein CHUAL_012677 [Chamberlinius hualienensis]
MQNPVYFKEPLMEDEEDFPGRLLHQAALWDNHELLEDLLNGDHLELINSKDEWDRSALHASSATDNSHCTRVLLQSGADPNISCSSKYDNSTPLHVAARHGRVETIKLLIEWKANIFSKDRRGLTPLDVAEQSGHEDCVLALKQAAAEFEQRLHQFYFALVEAQDSGDIGKMRQLIKDLEGDAALVVNSTPNGSNTLLFRAAESGQKDMVKLLLENGADGRVHLVTKYSPLHIACYNGKKEIVKLLLKTFSHLIQCATLEKWLPIHAAAVNGHVGVIDVLLHSIYPTEIMQTFRDKTNTWEYSMPFDINARDVTGQTVLYLACCVGNQKLVDLLLKFRVKAKKIDAVAGNGNEIAANESTSTTLAVMVKDSGRNRIDEQDDVNSPKRRLSDGIQMLMSKLNLNKNNAVDSAVGLNECLIQPVDLDVYCSNNTETALHVAIRHKFHSIASALLQNGANPNLKINKEEVDNSPFQDDDCTFVGSTGLVEACKNRDYGMIDLLIKNGARDDQCKALVVATRAQDEITVSKLLALKAHPDPEHKINKKAFDVIPVIQFGGLGFAGVGSVTYSSMFPTVPVMVNWHGQKCLDHLRKQWLIEASIAYNTKLKLSVKNQSIALFAITRLDVSNNTLRELPDYVFQLASLKYLNASQNKIAQLPAGVGSLLSSQSETPKKMAEYDCPILEEIYLQDNRLERIPPQIFSLRSLIVLDLSNNKLKSLPVEMWSAPKLRDLSLSFNMLSELPVRTPFKMVRLSSTNADSLSIDSKSASPKSSASGIFSLSGCSPGRNSVEIGEDGVKFCAIEEQKSRVDRINANSTNLITKDVIHSNLWSQNVEIIELILDENDFTKENQSKLMTLNLAHNAFETIPVGLACLAVNLARLNMSYNRLTEMGPIANYPVTLKHLDLSHNEVRNWPISYSTEELNDGTCYNSVLNSPKTSIKKSTSEFSMNSHLSSSSTSMLSLSSTDCCVHRRHFRLENLKTLILSDNLVDRLAINYIDEYASVGGASYDDELFDDGKCATVSVATPKSKLMFPSLSMLDVANNRLSEVPKSISELVHLSVFNISGNSGITCLPPEMGLLNKLWNLNTRGCNLNEPLKSMIDSKKYKTMDVVGYLKSILEDARPYARMKLMIVGVQGIGKTSLLEQLRHEGQGTYRRKPPEHWAKRMGNKNINLKTAKGTNLSTVGVDISDWTYEKKVRGQSSHGVVTFRTWDFGGQKEYYATHQYFLSKRSLYLVVWKITDGESGVAGIQQWLVNIQARAPNSPVIIIGTHYDLVKERYPPSFSEDLQQLIRDRFINIVDADKCGLPRVLDTIEISCRTRHNVKLLCNLIYDTVFELRSPGGKERLLEQKIPATYLALEDVVSYLSVERKLQNKDPVLQSEQYRMLVMHEMQERFHLGFRDLAELHQATAFLHENGVLLHYEDATLKDLYFLDPQWLCDVLAHVVTIREINPFAKSGVMRMDDLKLAFKSSVFVSMDVKNYIVNLLNKFEVALTWDNRTLLIPSLLPLEEQMRSGIPGCDVRIPVRSRGWIFRSKVFPTNKPNQPKCAEEAPDGSPLHCNEDYCIQNHFDPHASIRRLLIMSYFPSGFWPRLITRMLADDSVIDIIRSYFVVPKEAQHDPSVLKILEKRAEWVCWQTGIELRYAGTSLFHVKEVLAELNNYPCEYRQMCLMVQQEGVWDELDLSNAAMLEALIPNQTIVIKPPVWAYGEDSNSSEVLHHSVVLEPNPECVAKMLVLAVDHIDTLMEDWYPTLGTRFVHTSEGKFLVTRIVPCTPCLVNQFTSDSSSGCNPGNPSSSDSKDFSGTEPWNVVNSSRYRGEACVSQAIYLSGLDVAEKKVKPGVEMRSNGSRDSTVSHDSDSGVGQDSNVSSRKPSEEGQWEGGEGAVGLEELSKDDQNVASQHVVYCFMTEDCILTAYEERCMKCPVHGVIPLEQIAPDMIFMDLGERRLIRPDSIRRGKLLGRGAFGFVFQATVKSRACSMDINVAMKMLQPVDPGYGARQSATIAFKAAQSKWHRDPMQYASKAYCTARQELSILSTLRHPNIVPLVGICTHPLSLVLELAPQGSLDVMLKNYRRSGAKLNVFVIQKIIVQIAKALEYLHSHHIIYRDLKSENVLVWDLPPPFHGNYLELVNVKLADYGISRSTLPTGTKGFGGTEGFMAPEIMRHNGEEEYTEKVDCFSFGMFIYELVTLRLPFEGYETVKDHILDGGRPSLSRRETGYPTYVLDLMVMCWSQQPKDRPSASQIVSIGTAPEFVHLMDAVCLGENSAVTSGTVLLPTEDPGYPTFDLCLTRTHLDILTCTHSCWQQYKRLRIDSLATILKACHVGSQIWLGDSKGNIHIYSSITYLPVHTFSLDPDSSTLCGLSNLISISQRDLVVVTLANGRIFIIQASKLCSELSTKGELLREAITELGSNELPIHSSAFTLYPENSDLLELWCGQSSGQISIFSLNNLMVTAQNVLVHDDLNQPNLEVKLLTTELAVPTSIWSYVYPGCIVYHWDTNDRKMLNKLDCSKLAPCSESLKSISIEEHLSPGRCQVTAMTVVQGDLYIGTNWGCIIVAEGQTMRPITVFRPFEEGVKVILSVESMSTEEQQQLTQSPQKSPVREISYLTQSESISKNQCPTVITIGKGYRNLIDRFTNTSLFGYQQRDFTTNKKPLMALSWRSEHWAAN